MDDVVAKLCAHGNDRALIIDAPPELAGLAGAVEAAGVPVNTEVKGAYTFMLVFVTSADDAKAKAAETAPCLSGDGFYWLAYPKTDAAARRTVDIDRDAAWDALEPHGLRPVAQVALGENWSALRFRREEYSK